VAKNSVAWDEQKKKRQQRRNKVATELQELPALEGFCKKDSIGYSVAFYAPYSFSVLSGKWVDSVKGKTKKIPQISWTYV